MGRMFARVNSKCPTALVPALSSNCAAAFSETPARMQKSEIGFIRWYGSLRLLYLLCGAGFFDDHAAFFATESTGRHESFYLLKVVNPGSFSITPADVQPMYQPGVQATTDLLHLQVDPAPSAPEEKK